MLQCNSLSSHLHFDRRSFHSTRHCVFVWCIYCADSRYTRNIHTCLLHMSPWIEHGWTEIIFVKSMGYVLFKKKMEISHSRLLVAYRHTTEYGHRYTTYNVEICTNVHTTFIHVFHITFCARFIIFFALFIFRFSLLCPMAFVLNKFVFLFARNSASFCRTP